MRYWKAIYEDRSIGDFTDGRIYESDDSGYNLVDDYGYVFNFLKPNMFTQCEFEEVTRRDYLFQFEKEGKLEFNEQDFVNGDLAVRLDGWCKFSGELYEICNKYKLSNTWCFDGSSKYYVYYVIGTTVHFGIPESPTVNAWNILKKDNNVEEEENKMRGFKVGDKVRIIKELNGHEFKIGEEVLIFEDDKTYLPYQCRDKDGNEYWVDSSEIELIKDDYFELNISSKDDVTSCTYKLNGEVKKKESVSLYYKDTFDVETGVKEVLKKVFAKTPYEVFELKLENKLGHKPSNEELIEAYRKEMK